MSKKDKKGVEELLNEFRGVFRIKLKEDPPAPVEPFKAAIKPNATLSRTTQRRYAVPREHSSALL